MKATDIIEWNKVKPKAITYGHYNAYGAWVAPSNAAVVPYTSTTGRTFDAMTGEEIGPVYGSVYGDAKKVSKKEKKKKKKAAWSGLFGDSDNEFGTSEWGEDIIDFADFCFWNDSKVNELSRELDVA